VPSQKTPMSTSPASNHGQPERSSRVHAITPRQMAIPTRTGPARYIVIASRSGTNQSLRLRMGASEVVSGRLPLRVHPVLSRLRVTWVLTGGDDHRAPREIIAAWIVRSRSRSTSACSCSTER
jgi:hypothetical protein